MVAWEYALKDGTVYVIGHSAPLQYVRDRYGSDDADVVGDQHLR